MYGKSAEDNAITNHLQSEILEQEKPDIVVINGDAVNPNDWDGTGQNYF